MNLNQVTLPSKDVAASIAFYERLGLKTIVSALPTYARFLCPDGHATLSVSLVEHEVQHTATIYFECEDLDNRVKQLQEAGIGFDTQPQDKNWLWREAELRDPDGNRIKLYYAGENRVNPPWRIN